jgi:hypothetical protein
MLFSSSRRVRIPLVARPIIGPVCGANRLYRLVNASDDVTGPINLGTPAELTIGKFAERIIKIAGSSSRMEYGALPADDPMQRQPDIALARKLLDWSPVVAFNDELRQTIASGFAGELILRPLGKVLVTELAQFGFRLFLFARDEPKIECERSASAVNLAEATIQEKPRQG